MFWHVILIELLAHLCPIRFRVVAFFQGAIESVPMSIPAGGTRISGLFLYARFVGAGTLSLVTLATVCAPFNVDGRKQILGRENPRGGRAVTMCQMGHKKHMHA